MVQEKLRAVLYARVSTAEEEQLKALPKQIEECKATVQSRDWKLVDQYVDEGKSGTQIKQRTEYQRLLSDIETDKFDVIVVKSQDRLQRNPGDWYIFVDKLIKAEKQLFLYLDNKFFTPADDGLITGIKAILAAEYSRDLSKKLNNSAQRRIEKVRRGEKVAAMGTNMCYGYYIKNGEWIVDHEQAKVAKLMYELYLEHDSIRKVVDTLNESGYRNQKGNKFCSDSVARVLKNPRYKGTLVVNRFHRDFDKHCIEERPEEEWVVQDNAFEAVIDSETWQKVNDRLALKRANNKGRKISRDPLGGKMFCYECGAPLWRHKSNGYYSWYCSQKMSRGKSACVGASISEKRIRGIMKEISKDLVVNKKAVKASMLDWLENVKKSLNVENNNETYIKELERLKTQESRLVDKYVDGKISDEIYDKKYSEIQNQIVRIEKLLVPVEENEDLKDIQEVIDNLDQEIDEWIKTEDFEENKADFIIEHVKQIKIMHDKHIIIYLDLVGGAIIAGKNFLLFVSESMPQPYGGICDEGFSGKGGDFRAV